MISHEGSQRTQRSLLRIAYCVLRIACCVLRVACSRGDVSAYHPPRFTFHVSRLTLVAVFASCLPALALNKTTNISPGAAAATNGLRDIKPPVVIPSGWAWVLWTAGALALAAALWFGIRYWQKRRAQVPIVPPIPPHVRAKQKLEEALALIGQPKEFCILVSDTIRWYLEERFDFRAPERTTEEFLHELRGTNLLTRGQKETLGDFLQQCDLVKFAKYEPREPELRDLHASAVRLVEETEPVPTPQPAGNGAAPTATPPPVEAMPK